MVNVVSEAHVGFQDYKPTIISLVVERTIEKDHLFPQVVLRSLEESLEISELNLEVPVLFRVSLVQGVPHEHVDGSVQGSEDPCSHHRS